ncbi:MPN domain-containing protein [Flavisolibacter ginsengisoli]|jgi:proteasome lid subunit RPN8/RPN11|uniref:JAB domain-containing protein n=1 Tax=Flavisolibacter ginsengisoli DSM 18119 TaxID=1121884 RepID=A0A1M5BC27_9BACT|nr:Mov34/MPN/PAD-1 family protein [Flavisolibacter ginsengisoli]SHF40064.1 JAB domain-containing protein [Flavisolibacter ginsengisoli DSM 18119]
MNSEPIGLMHIKTVFIPQEFVDAIYKEFQVTGSKGYERLALLAGSKKGKEFIVTNLIYPAQELHRSRFGVSFYVSGAELGRLWDWLYGNKRILIAQVHSHPTEAYHSKADDDMAIITTFGGLSLVVPDFGNSDQSFEGSAIFRLQPESGWTELTKEQINHLLKITQ